MCLSAGALLRITLLLHGPFSICAVIVNMRSSLQSIFQACVLPLSVRPRGVKLRMRHSVNSAWSRMPSRNSVAHVRAMSDEKDLRDQVALVFTRAAFLGVGLNHAPLLSLTRHGLVRMQLIVAPLVALHKHDTIVAVKRRNGVKTKA